MPSPRTFRRFLGQVAAAFVGVGLTFIPTSAAFATPPSLPAGEILHSYGTWGAPQKVISIDPTTATGTYDYPSATAGTFQEAAAAGFDPSTGLTWLLEARNPNSCELWQIDSVGALTRIWTLDTATTGLTGVNLNNCWSASFNGDGTAWVFSRDAGGSMTDKIVKIDLATGAALTSAVQVTVFTSGAWAKLEVSSLAVDPTTGQLWAAAPNGWGILKLDPTTGHLTDRINLVGGSIAQDVYDMDFDSTGRLWLAMYDVSPGNTPSLASIVPTNANPISTYSYVGVLQVGGSNLDTNILWITGSATPASTAPSTATPALAATGISQQISLFAWLLALVAMAVGIALLLARRRQGTHSR